VLTPNTAGAGVSDPAADPTLPPDEQWSSHFGWGRADLGAAVAAAQSGDIPPEAAIDSPGWYAPLTGSSVEVTGLARARFATGGQLHWKLMWGPGQAPASWTTVGEGSSSGTVTDFGSLDLAAIRTALASYVVPPDAGGPTFAAAEPNPFQHEFTVQLEVNGQGIPLTGIDRRVLDTFTDPTLAPGFPKLLGSGGESSTRYADLNGDNVQELIVPTEDGLVHAYEPNGSELRGWPVHTEAEQAGLGHTGSPGLATLGLPREPPRGPLLADLANNGHPDVIVAAGTHVYAWHSNGAPVRGFPVSSNPAFCGPGLEGSSSHPKCGFLGAPATAHLEGASKGVDIVEASLDGHLYAWRPNGTTVPGYPVALLDPAEVAAGKQMVAESINDPAVGDLNGDGHDDIVIASNEVYGAPENGTDVSFAEVTAAAAGSSGRLYAIDGRTGKIMPGWPVAMPGIIQNVLPLVGPGQDASIAKIGGETVIDASVTGGALEELSTSGQVLRTMQQTGPQAFGPAADAPQWRTEPVRVGLGRRSAGNRHARRRQVRAVAEPGSEPAARRAELPVQPPDRRIRRDQRRDAPGLPDNHRRLPVPVGQRRRQDRPAGADQPDRRGHGARAPARIRRRDGPRRRRVPQADRRLAGRARGAVRGRTHGGHDA